jgi:RNA polymerase sigma-70 factor, ECF subfamily
MNGIAVRAPLLKITMGRRIAAQENCLTRFEEPPEPAAEPAEKANATDRVAGDAELLAACRAGNLAAYERLYQAHGARMKSIARNLLGNAHDAEDVVQDVFLKVHRSIGSFLGQSAFSTWIYRILLNCCYDVRRKRLRRQEAPEENMAPEGSFDPPAARADHPLRLMLERSVAKLGEDQRKVFLLFEVEGFSHAEIAQMMDISETASKNRLYQAKVNLRRFLTETMAPQELRNP